MVVLLNHFSRRSIRLFIAAIIAVCFILGLRCFWILYERWHCEREIAAAGGASSKSANASTESSFASSILSSDRYISIPGPSVSDRRLTTQTLDEILIRLGRVCRIRSLWLTLSPEVFGDTEHWTPDILTEILRSCPELQSLSLSGSLADDSLLLDLPDLCPNLVILRIGRTRVQGSRHPGAPEAKGITSLGLREIDKLRKLEVLDCRGVTLGNESVTAIAESHSLRAINISECGLKFEDVERMLSTRSNRLIVVSEYVIHRSTVVSSISKMDGTNPGLSDQVELQRDAFPNATLITTGDWYKWREIFGEFPDRNAWYQVDWNAIRTAEE